MIRIRSLAVMAVLATGLFTLSRFARAGDDAPKAPVSAPAAPTAEAPKATEPAKTEAPATKTPTPMHSLLGYIAKQVAPSLECPCPSTAEGEKAWRGWFAGDKTVPMAGLRDALVADGWNADRFVTFFKAMKAECKCGDCAKGDCAKGDCAKGDCAKGDCAKGGCGCGKNKEGKKDAPPAEAKPAPAPAPTEAPAAKP